MILREPPGSSFERLAHAKPWMQHLILLRIFWQICIYVSIRIAYSVAFVVAFIAVVRRCWSRFKNQFARLELFFTGAFALARTSNIVSAVIITSNKYRLAFLYAQNMRVGWNKFGIISPHIQLTQYLCSQFFHFTGTHILCVAHRHGPPTPRKRRHTDAWNYYLFYDLCYGKETASSSYTLNVWYLFGVRACVYSDVLEVWVSSILCWCWWSHTLDALPSAQPFAMAVTSARKKNRTAASRMRTTKSIEIHGKIRIDKNTM